MKLLDGSRSRTSTTETCPTPVGLGSLTVITGPMFAGKTSRLIELAHAAHTTGRDVFAFKSSLDTRCAVAELATHDGLRMDARPVADFETLCQALSGHPHASGDRRPVCFVDEVQIFF